MIYESDSCRDDLVYLSHEGVAHDENPPGRGSGRYPFGSGTNPYQHGGYPYKYMNGRSCQEFLDYVKTLRTGYTDENGTKHAGLSNKEIALFLGMTTTNPKTGEIEGDAQTLQRRLEYLNEESRNEKYQKVRVVQQEHPEYFNEETGQWSATSIAKALGMSASQESTVRGWLEKIDEDDNYKIANICETLAVAIKENPLRTVGPGTAETMGVTQTKLDAALQRLQDEEGYNLYMIKIPQPNNELNYTTIKTLAGPEMNYAEAWKNRGLIRPIVGYWSEDDGETFNEYGLREPASVSSDRVQVIYDEDGGGLKDGLIELRAGIDELSLCGKRYAQVRIAVDGTHYLKGMAVVNDDTSDWPKGVDIRFNTSKTKDIPVMGPDKDHSVLKILKDDPNNRFGSMLKTEEQEYVDPESGEVKTASVVIGQRDYTDPVTGEKKLSPINVCREEGDWEKWSKSLPSQMWSKQTKALAERQLRWGIDEKRTELEEIKSLTNPEIKKALLEEFADKCDTAAVNLKAAAMPGQTTNVIIPVPSLKSNEIYAPGYTNGDEVVCIRYPHGGIFEIPHLVVNNKNKEGKKLIGTVPIDAVGLPKAAAEQLSGADYDGDTVVVIPLKGQEDLVRYKPMLKEMVGFSTSQYAKTDDQIKTGPKKKGGDGFNTQREMGIITNLIMDMTQAGATDEELARADKHSMVVIDAEKHNLDHQASYQQNNILELKKKYQDKGDGKYGGAGTLITRAKSPETIPHRRQVYSYSEMTPEEKERYDRGEIIYRDSGKTKSKFNKKTGEWELVGATIKTKKMATVNDAYELITGEGTDMEKLGAEYANTMKAMANEARRESRNTSTTKVNVQARQVYAKEVEELKADIARAKSNKPLEQSAQALAHYTYKKRLEDSPELKEDKDYVKKIKNQTLTEARRRLKANKKNVYVRLDERKIEAMNAGALSSSNITAVINNCDKDQFKKLAMPHKSNELSLSDQLKIKHLSEAYKDRNDGTLADIAEIVGCSVSTVKKYMN